MPPSGFLLRVCELGDLGQVARLEKESFPERPYTRLDFAYYLLAAREGFVVATKDGLVAGYVIAVREGREGWVQSIAVQPALRRKGVGEALLRSALKHLSGRAVRVRLLVAADNFGAMSLYRKLSFKETGRVVRGYYPNGSDAVEMDRRI
jgi:[ribosomal protein S18]-alanine N-acetyltransferase